MVTGGGSRPSPVWRIAISEEPENPDESPLQRSINTPDSTAFEPDRMSLISNSDQLDLERFVWFAQADPAALGGYSAAEASQIYWNRSGAPQVRLRPASYLVVGPRPETRIGSQAQSANPPEYRPSQQRMTLLPGMPQFAWNNSFRPPPFNYDPANPPYTAVKPALTMVAAANPPPAWSDPATTAPTGIGLSVTEPLPGPNYYPEPTDSLRDPPEAFPVDSYYNYDNPVSALPDQPFDATNDMLASFSSVADLDEGAGGAVEQFRVESQADFKTAFLQRLANPLEPWHPDLNPYITIDWIPIDVTLFNGEDSCDTSGDFFFDSRERSGANQNVWAAETATPSANQAAPTSVDYFNFTLQHTLGFLNEPFGVTLGVPNVPQPYAGDPAAQPFPWLSWNNRPFANPFELMQVPASSPSRLTHEFDIFQGVDPYDASVPNNWQRLRGNFPHLLNFFHTSDPDQGEFGTNYYRLFEYVETPSRFVGAEKWYNPLATRRQPGGPTNPIGRTFRPPYNHLSRFRDPGRVNINTIFDPKVWEGIVKAYPAMDPTTGGIGPQMFERIFRSRQGYTGPMMNPDYPTFFSNPFRSAGSADLMPDVEDMRKFAGVQATLFREDLLNGRAESLFVPTPTITEQLADHRRNPYFRYQGLARLSNLLSNNSNVFAMWITLGYFEVEKNPATVSPGGVDAAHPDGFRLGRELGSERGEVERHRAFFIIDRSVPVAFVPGENHNVDHCVLLRRFIE